MRKAPAGTTTGRLAAVLVVFLVLLGVAPELSAAEGSGFEITTPVRQQLYRIQQGWQHWIQAYEKDDREGADKAMDEIVLALEYLGMSRLPDLSNAAAVLAVRSAEQGNLQRARWSLIAARRLDPERPETEFAAVTVARIRGDFGDAIGKLIEGYSLLFKMPLVRTLWLQNLGLWWVYLLMLSGGLFITLQMVFKGASLFYDLGRLVSPPLPRVAADLVAVVLLIWPLFLPSGFVWLALYWSILLWGYATISERVVLTLLWVVLGAVPVAITLQQREVRLALTPPSRVMENLAANRLYGSLFIDFDILCRLVGKHEVVAEMTADLHRRLGQWEHARLEYTSLIDGAEGLPTSAPALTNLGIYYYRKGDYGAAINYFSDAINADDDLVEAHYNLAQSYAQNFQFPDSHAAMAQAKNRNSDLVARWDREAANNKNTVIPVDGSLRRAGEIRRILLEPRRSKKSEPEVADPTRFLSVAVAVLATVLAVLFHSLRKRKGYPSQRFPSAADRTWPGEKWLRILAPGWISTQQGQGGRAFVGILLPMALVTIPLTRMVGYRVPLGYSLGAGLIFVACGTALLLLYLIRLGLGLRAD